MKYYRNTIGEVFAYETQLEREEFGFDDMTEMLQHEIDEYLNRPHIDVAPKNVTRAQGKAALIRAGLWQGVVNFVNAISDPVEKAVAEVALNDTTHWQRSSPFLNSAAESLGLTDEQLDKLFIDASKIEL